MRIIDKRIKLFVQIYLIEYNAYLKLGTVGLIEQVHRKLGLHSFELLQNIQYMALLIGELSHGLPRYLSKQKPKTYFFIQS